MVEVRPAEELFPGVFGFAVTVELTGLDVGDKGIELSVEKIKGLVVIRVDLGFFNRFPLLTPVTVETWSRLPTRFPPGFVPFLFTPTLTNRLILIRGKHTPPEF